MIPPAGSKLAGPHRVGADTSDTGYYRLKLAENHKVMPDLIHKLSLPIANMTFRRGYE